MSLLDTASLIVTPNGYKEGKLYSVIPSDGSGDLSVTRATTATRVNSQGLVELVPYNLVSYSEDLSNAFWTKTAATITANAITAPNGTLTADALFETTANSQHNFYGNYTPTISGNVYTISFYAKANGRNKIRMNNGSSSLTVEMNLSTGVATQLTGTSTNVMTNVGDGWYRCSMTYTATSDPQYVAMNTRDDSGNDVFVGDASKGVYFWGLQGNEGTLKDYQKTETRLNIPRLDYSNGTCPSILVEPQRTNVCLQSSNLTSVWSNGGGATITANATTAPDGTLTADRVQFVTGSAGYVYQTLSGLSAGSVTLSGYFKSVSGNATIGFNDGNFNANSINITDEWQRYTFTFNYAGAGIGFQIDNYFGVSPSQQAKDFYVWGLQAEAGSYATSYIPTTSASVTRNADVISKTGISSLIGQTEGTLFVDVYRESESSQICVFLSNSTGVNAYMNSIYIFQIPNNYLTIDCFVSNVGQFSIQTGANLSVGRHKIAVAYKQNDAVVYVDGVLFGSDNSCNIPPMSVLDLNPFDTGFANNAEINATALWKQRLSNTQLAQLTTI